MKAQEESRKKEKRIRFAGEFRNMPTDIHTRLIKFATARRYETLFAACLYLIDEALTLHEMVENEALLLREKSAQIGTQQRGAA